MKKSVILWTIASLTAAMLPVNAGAEPIPEADEVVIYDEVPEKYSLPVNEEFRLSDEASMEVVTISTAEELIAFRNNMNSDSDYSKDKIFRLTNSIDLGGIEWEPIGYNDSYQIGDNLNKLRDYAFRGVFDGQGNTISNFKMTDESLSYMGFFGTIHLGTVRNLNLADVSIDYSGTTSSQIPEFTGILAAFSNYADISNCNVSGNISIENTDTYISGTTVCAGMISGVGLAKVDGCSATGNITINTLVPPYAGGIWGFGSVATAEFDAAIIDCISDVSIDMESISGICAGGIIGRGSDSLNKISGCEYSKNSAANITANHTYSSENLNSVSLYLGGIAGVNSSILENCSVGEIEIISKAESAPIAGGIAGKNEAQINNCSTNADLKTTLTRSELRAAASPTIGGIAGTNGSSHSTTSDPIPNDVVPVIKNCSIGSDVSIDITSDSGAAAVAGFVSGITYAPAEIINCTSASSDMMITSSNAGVYAGGICGHLNGGAARYCSTTGVIGENISAATSIYIGGIVGDANLKYFYTYDTSFGITSPLFTVAKFYGAVIEDCYSEIDITAKNSNRIYAGGICGYLIYNYIEDDTNYYINANRDIAISRCSAAGDVTVTPTLNTFAGGAIGYSVDGKVYDTYSTGTVTVTKDESSVYAGGFMGAVYQNGHSYDGVTATIDNCYTTSTLRLPENASKLSAGAFVARVVPSATTKIEPQLTNCYYPEGSTQSECEGLTSISTEQLGSADTFANWNFDDVWTISDEKPVLRFEKTGVYKHTSEEGIIKSLLITRVPNYSKVFAITYSDDSIVNTQVYDIDDSNYINEYFQPIDCDITLSDDTVTKIYIWGGDDIMEPLCEVEYF